MACGDVVDVFRPVPELYMTLMQRLLFFQRRGRFQLPSMLRMPSLVPICVSGNIGRTLHSPCRCCHGALHVGDFAALCLERSNVTSQLCPSSILP